MREPGLPAAVCAIENGRNVARLCLQPERDAKLLRIKSKDQSEDEQMLRRRQRNHARRDFRSPEKAATLSA
jgi:hypothetical protein